MKLLNLDPIDRVNCIVVYVVNRFEVLHADGWMMTAAYTVKDLKSQLKDNGIDNPNFSTVAALKYLGD